MIRKTDDEIIAKKLEEGATQKEIAEFFGVSPPAICKRVKRISLRSKIFAGLTAKEQRFSIEISKGKTQTQAALASHDCSSLASAKSMGSQLMRKPQVKIAIADLMDHHGMNRSYRIGKLKTHVDNRDPNVSLKALDQSWKLDGGYTEEKVEIEINFQELQMSVQEYDRELKRLEAELGDEVFCDDDD